MPITQYNFPPEYRDLCFSIWYKSLRPTLKQLHAIIPESCGNRPSIAAIQKWHHMDGWEERADDVQLQVRDRLAADLVSERTKMLREQADQAAIVRNTAFDYITTTGFDSASSAVQALKWAIDTEQKARGIESALINMGTATEDQLKKEFMKLIEGASELGVVDAESDIVEEIDEEVPSE
jgi:uncharacterized membrane protein